MSNLAKQSVAPSRRRHLTSAPPPNTSGALVAIYPLRPARGSHLHVIEGGAHRGHNRRCHGGAPSGGSGIDLTKGIAIFVFVSSLTLAVGAIVFSRSHIVGQSSTSQAGFDPTYRSEMLRQTEP